MKKLNICLILILIISVFISNLSYAELLDDSGKFDVPDYNPVSVDGATGYAAPVPNANSSTSKKSTTSPVKGDGTATQAPSGPVSQSNGTLSSKGLDGDGQAVDPVFSEKAGKIIGAMQMIGYFLAVGIIVYVGIKYIMASGDEKADLKTALPKYFMGALLIVLCDTITIFIFDTLK